MKISKGIVVVTLFISLAIVDVSVVRAQTFTEPTEDFPNGNPAAPLDTSNTNQTKTGALKIGTDSGKGIFIGSDSLQLLNGGIVNGILRNLQTPEFFNQNYPLYINTKGLRLPNLTPQTANPATGATGAGTIIYDTTSKTLKLFDGTTWKEIMGGGGGSDSFWNVVGTKLHLKSPLNGIDVSEGESGSRFYAIGFSRSADTNLKPDLFSEGNSSLLLGATSTRTDLTIAANGNVGVGTLNPRAKFEILGGVKIASPIGGQNYLEFGSGASDSWTGFGDPYTFDEPNANEDTCNADVTSAYSCGENTHKPNGCVDIAKGVYQQPGQAPKDAWAKQTVYCVSPDEPLYKIGNEGGILKFKNNTNEEKVSIKQNGDLDIKGDYYRDGVLFRPGGSGGGPSQWSDVAGGIFYNGGNVGIGTTAPKTKLHLAGTTQHELVRLEGSQAVVMTIKEGDQEAPKGAWRLVADGGYLRIDRNKKTTTAGDFAEYHTPLALSPNGVTTINGTTTLIGTDEPLIVKNNGYYFFAGANRGGGDFVDIGAYFKTNDSNGRWEDLVLNRDGGNVGIGTKDPKEKLSVQGSIALLRPVGNSVLPGPGPALFFQSPASNNVSGSNDGTKPCGGSNEACPEDTTPPKSVIDAYTCQTSDAGREYTDVVTGPVPGSTQTQKSYTKLTCTAGVESYSLLANAGTFEFRNDENVSKVVITQDGKVGIGKTNPQWALEVSGIVSSTQVRSNAIRTPDLVVASTNPNSAPNFAVTDSNGKRAFWDGETWVPHGTEISCSNTLRATASAKVEDGQVRVRICINNCKDGIGFVTTDSNALGSNIGQDYIVSFGAGAIGVYNDRRDNEITREDIVNMLIPYKKGALIAYRRSADKAVQEGVCTVEFPKYSAPTSQAGNSQGAWYSSMFPGGVYTPPAGAVKLACDISDQTVDCPYSAYGYTNGSYPYTGMGGTEGQYGYDKFCVDFINPTCVPGPNTTSYMSFKYSRNPN